MCTAFKTPRGEAPDRQLASVPEPAVADDILIFEHVADGFTLVGGTGQRSGWAGIVELSPQDDGLVGSAWRRGTAERISGRRSLHVAVPYYARYAVAVPVGHSHVVVFGGKRPIVTGESQLVRLSAAEVEALAEAMGSFLKRPDLIPSLSRAARLKAERRFDVADVNRTVASVLGLA